MTPHNTPRASLDRSQTQRVTTNNNHELDGIEMVALQRGLGLDLEAQAVEHDNEGEPVLYCRGRLALVLSLCTLIMLREQVDSS